jgi:hypothetical protein
MTYKRFENIDKPLFTAKEISDNVYYLVFHDLQKMGSTFVRFQEFYESPEFKGKYFTLDQFKDWYMKSRQEDTFKYYDDWYGYNIPSEALIPFYEGYFDPLTENEQKLLEYFKDIKGKFYIIACIDNMDQERNLAHELAHALYYTNSEYKKEVDDFTQSINKVIVNAFKDCFSKSAGYHPDVFWDEMQAYLVAFDYSTMIKKISKLLNRDEKQQLSNYAISVSEIFKKYNDNKI